MTPRPLSQVPFGQDPGKLLEGATTCPHCGGVARSSPHPELRYICDICGAPRIDVRAAGILSGREKPHLTAAKNALRQRAIWRVAGVFGGIASAFGLFVFLILAWLFSFGFLGTTIGLAMVLPFILLVLASFTRSKSKTAAIDKALREAWKSAAQDVVTAGKKGMTAAELSRVLSISEEEADKLAGDLTADTAVTSRVTEDGRLIYEPGTGLRIDAGGEAPAVVGDPLEERFAELERQQAEEEKLRAKR